MNNKSDEKRWVRQLARLETLIDVVYALAIWRLFQILPRPMENETRSVWEVFMDDPRPVLTVIIGMAIVIIYWLQNNLLFGHLERTDTRHTVLSILQIFCLLLFLYAIRVGTNYEAATDLRVFESLTALLVGVPSYFAWRHAKYKGGARLAVFVEERSRRDLRQDSCRADHRGRDHSLRFIRTRVVGNRLVLVSACGTPFAPKAG